MFDFLLRKSKENMKLIFFFIEFLQYTMKKIYELTVITIHNYCNFLFKLNKNDIKIVKILYILVIY